MEKDLAQLGGEETAVSDGPPDNRFVPLTPDDLIAQLLSDAERFGCDSRELADAFEAIRQVLEQEGVALLRRLDRVYLPFDPDRETFVINEGDDAGEEDAGEGDAGEGEQAPPDPAELQAALDYLLDKANFEKLSDVQIEAAVRRAQAVNLRVRINPDEVKWLHVWVRGQGCIERCRRTLKRPVKGVPVTLPAYRRMAVAVQLADSPHVMVKVFKDIPEAEIEALLPNARARMSLLDRLKVFFGGAGAIGATAFKLLKIAVTLAAISKLLWIVLAGAATLLIRTLFGYRGVCRDRELQRTRHLYFQNLGNNGAALQLLLTLVKREELKEALLGYCFCLGQERQTATELSDAVEAYLAETFAADVDFDVTDALETLDRLGVWLDRDRLCAAPPPAATEQLLEHWAQRRSHGYHDPVCAARREGDG